MNKPSQMPNPDKNTTANHILAVKQVSLNCFRNYRDLLLVLDSSPVVLTGSNGSGKTNLLEALSLLVPGRGLRRANLNEMQHKEFPSSWAVAVELYTPAGNMRIGTGREQDISESDQNRNGAERRIIHVDGKAVKSQQILAEHVAMTWITPDMDRVLAEGASARRKLVDRLVYSFDPAHAGRVHRYEKALRERLRLMRDCIADPAWLSALEDEMAQTGVAIAAARRQMLKLLQTAIAETAGVFPKADLSLHGIAEEALIDNPALLVEDKLRAALARTRGEDAQNGTCAIGPHRSDLVVIHREKNCPAELCSTGEQKALLIAIMLAYIRILTRAREMSPIILLDDIAAHLDITRRMALFEEISSIGAQVWFTGTDSDQFHHFLSKTQHFVVNNGTISTS